MMLRLGKAILIVGLTLFGSGLQPDKSFRAGMVRVNLALKGGRSLLVSRYEVSVASWRQCYAEHGCSYLPRALGAASNPVTDVNKFDVEEYIHWANGKFGGGLRLPSLAEWRELYQPLAKPKATPHFTDPRMAWAEEYGQEVSPTGPVLPQGAFSTTAAGISDLDGNVWEWTASCFRQGFNDDHCPAFVAGGAHEAAVSVFIRNPASGGCATGTPPTYLGFRLVADP
jgi:formylglycine-generating enzyme required for sulfatase activity